MQSSKTIPSGQENGALGLRQKRDDLLADLPRLDAPVFIERHTRILDEYFRERFETSLIGPQLGIVKNPYVFIALGGYGRGEQCVHSDVDLLFLFKKNVPDGAESLIQEIVYPLWDIGLEVGYAIRSLKECVALARQDHEVLTPLLDSRFICGVSLLYSELMEQLHRKILSRRPRQVIDWLIATNRQRHVTFGDSTYRLEPNLKEGQGGLRDYHTMLWLARIEYQLKQPRDLEYLGQLSHGEYQNLIHALTFIWNVRNHLHLLCGRKCDQLHFESQIKLAETLGFRKSNGQQAVEVFLGVLQGQMEFIKQQHLMFLYDLGYMTKGRSKKKPLKQTAIKGLAVDRDSLTFTSPADVVRTPALLINIFEESLRLKLPLSAEATRVVREFTYLADDDFINAPATVQAFERILLSPARVFSVLREMLNTGFLVRLIPEFHGVVNRIQYDEYHVYPVDKHLLRTVQAIKNFGTGDDPHAHPLYPDLYRKLKHRNLLLWAALLHDIGKGVESDNHSVSGADMARRVLAAKGFSAPDIETVAFLVQKHLYLVKTATRRDIHDEETAIACAREIEDIERLKMLYLLTVADCMSTGPNAWNEWTAILLRDLFLKVLNILQNGELATREAVQGIELKKERVLATVKTDAERRDLGEIFGFLSPRYLLYATPDQILQDIDCYQRLAEREFMWNVTRAADSETRTVKICAKDRPGLFSKIAGVFTLNNIDIIDAQIFTWRNRIAVDIFEVKPPPDQLFEEERWLRAEENLEEALADKLDLTEVLRKKIAGSRRKKPPLLDRPNRVEVDNHSSSFFTIIEVFTYDYPGLLFNITDAIFACRLDIWVAKIATKVDQVVDVFYVRDFDGQKVDVPEQVEAIKKTISDRLLVNKRLGRTAPVAPL
ncbi:MAG: [protein-PII] uridylyltransferase [Desulfobacterales bacterium]